MYGDDVRYDFKTMQHLADELTIQNMINALNSGVFTDPKEIEIVRAAIRYHIISNAERAVAQQNTAASSNGR